MSRSEFQWEQLGEITRRFLSKPYSRRTVLATGIGIGAASTLGIQSLSRLFRTGSTPEISDQAESTRQPIIKKEILGYVPHWTIQEGISADELDSLTTLAYFNFPLGGDGNPMLDNPGYQVLQSRQSADLFDRARKSNTQLMLTTAVENRSGQMDSEAIVALMFDKDAQKRAIDAIIREKKRHGMNSINVDFEHWGEVTPELRNNFSNFVQDLKDRSDARVTVAVYASSANTYHMFDVARLSQVSDGLAIMAYDFYGPNAKIVAPTAPLYGHKEGRYWYDVETAVADFKALVPPEKIQLIVPQYGHSYLVAQDEEMTPVRDPFYLNGEWIDHEVLTMGSLRDRLALPINQSSARNGWDSVAKERWYSYILEYGGTPIRRMVYMEDADSIGYKSDLILAENLGGIGFWATGFNGDDKTVADMLKQKFG